MFIPLTTDWLALGLPSGRPWLARPRLQDGAPVVMCRKLIVKNAQGLGRKKVPRTDDACLIFALPYCFHGVPTLSLAQDWEESAVLVTVCIARMHTSP